MIAIKTATVIASVTGNAIVTGIPAQTAASRAITTTTIDAGSGRAAGTVIVTASVTGIVIRAPSVAVRAADAAMITTGVVVVAPVVATTSAGAMIEAAKGISRRKGAAGNAHTLTPSTLQTVETQ